MRETIPETIRIGAADFDVAPIPALEGDKFALYGYMHWPSQHIRYVEGLPRQRLAEILLHEVIHGLWKEYELREEGPNGQDIEENYVKALGKGFLQIIRDNPDLIAWVSQSFSDGETLERVPPLWEPIP